MKWSLLKGNVFDMLPTIEKGSIDCVVTSPPYWKLRSYLSADDPLKPLELGSEPTPQEFVQNQVRVMSLVRDCLADHGTVWLNIGDTYSHAPGKRKPTDAYGAKQLTNGFAGTTGSASAPGIDDGNLCLIPWRLAIALQDDGWYVRSIVVWHKPAPMPASLAGWMWVRCRVKVKNGWTSSTHPSRSGVAGDISQSGGVATGKRDGIASWTDCPGCKKCDQTDGLVLRKGSWRPTSSWEPILMLAKTDRYFADGEPVKTPPKDATKNRDKYTRVLDDPEEQFAVKHDHETVCESGANLRDVWTIGAEPLKEKHYAAFPTRLVIQCLKAGVSQEGYCPACGLPWVRIVTEEYHKHRGESITGNRDDGPSERGWDGYPCLTKSSATLGWRPSCKCPPAKPRPGRVLDPFAGSGRTMIAARRLGFDAVGVELNPKYCEMIERRVRDDMPLFATPEE